jgi:hypothetical protein
MTKVAIVQSNYIPWRGYFDLIAAADELILYDDMQYTRRDWRNRNKIKTPQGLQWLTVPVKVKGKYHQRIRDTELDGTDWQESHWKSLMANYSRAAHIDAVAKGLAPLYLETTYSHLSSLNRTLIEWVCTYLGIETRIKDSSEFRLVEGKTERLLDLCRQVGATHYISGPAARDYLDESMFLDAGIAVTFFHYDGYSAYPQLWGEFAPAVSILDLLFNCGPGSKQFLRYIRE